MGSLRRFRPSPAMIVAIIALVLSLGGTSYAAITLPRNSVGTAQIKKNAVTGAKVKNYSLSLSDIKGSSLSTLGRVADGDGSNVSVDPMTKTSVATVSLTAPRRGFVFVEGWACMDGGGSCHVALWDDIHDVAASSYNAVTVDPGQEAGCSVSNVLPVGAGQCTFSLVAVSSAGATAWGNVSAVFIPYGGAGSSTP